MLVKVRGEDDRTSVRIRLSFVRQDEYFALGHAFDVLLQPFTHFIEADLPLHFGLDDPVN